VSADQIERALTALRGLEHSGKPGADVLAAQLAGLVAVMAAEATKTARVRKGLIEALTVAAPSMPPVAPRTRPTPVSDLLDPTKVLQESGPDTLRKRLGGLSVKVLREIVKTNWPDVHPSKLNKGPVIDLIVKRATDSAEQNPTTASPAESVPPTTKVQSETKAQPAKRKRRPSPVNPYVVTRESGLDGLREQLATLDIEELKDVVVEYGWNYPPPATSQKNPAKIIDRIIENTRFETSRGEVSH